MPSRSQAALGHILDNILLARELSTGSDDTSFARDWRLFYAATRCLEIISEASRRLDHDIKARHPEVDWRDVADAGNLYRHGYEVISPLRVWETVVKSLPPLEAAVLSELKQLAD